MFRSLGSSTLCCLLAVYEISYDIIMTCCMSVSFLQDSQQYCPWVNYVSNRKGTPWYPRTGNQSSITPPPTYPTTPPVRPCIPGMSCKERFWHRSVVDLLGSLTTRTLRWMCIGSNFFLALTLWSWCDPWWRLTRDQTCSNPDWHLWANALCVTTLKG